MIQTRAWVAAVFGAALAARCASPAPAPQSAHTSIRTEDCAAPPDAVAAPFASKDLGVQQCPAPAGWGLLLVASDANTWIELRAPSFTWSSERAVVYESPVGLFPSIGEDDTVEWRGPRPGELAALIFRVTAQDPENPAAHRSMLFVTRIEPDRACLLGRVATPAEARALADSSRRCPTAPGPA